jgi:hypothetical protein
LLCTEKDACNLAGAFGGGLPVYYARISMDVPRGDEFWRTVADAAERNHGETDAGARR